MVQMSKGDKHPQALVYIHEGAPVDLLLGTDVLPLLGFSLREPVAGGPYLDMFSGGALVEEQGSEGDSVKEPVTPQGDFQQTNMDSASDLSPVGIVRLLCPTRLPPRHAKLAAVRTEGKDQQFLLEPVESLLAEKGVLVQTGLVQVDKEGCSYLLLQNRTAEPIWLEEGQVMGQTQTVQIVHSTTPEDNSVRRLEVSSSNPAPDVTVDEVTFPHLSADERGKLQSCLWEYARLFVNGDLDLGSTDVATHTIDTGDHPATRQPPRCIPFSLRSHVEKMIRQIEEQEVIQPSKSPRASPIVFFAKGGITRFCVDYRKLNAITKIQG